MEREHRKAATVGKEKQERTKGFGGVYVGGGGEEFRKDRKKGTSVSIWRLKSSRMGLKGKGSTAGWVGDGTTVWKEQMWLKDERWNVKAMSKRASEREREKKFFFWSALLPSGLGQWLEQLPVPGGCGIACLRLPGRPPRLLPPPPGQITGSVLCRSPAPPSPWPSDRDPDSQQVAPHVRCPRC